MRPAKAFRRDLTAVKADKDHLIEFSQISGRFRREAQEAAKPTRCKICGEEGTSFCRSHTIPKYCLREIAVDGKLLTFSGLLGTNLNKEETGIGDAGVFRIICKRCDTEFFKLYETLRR